MAALGIAFAVLTRSEAIMLDGLFSLVACAMGIVSLRVAKLLDQPDDEQFQFGYTSFEPFVNLIKGLIMAFLGVFALYSASDALLHGGRAIATGWALLYAVFGVAGCFAIAAFQRRTARKTESPLVEVDAQSWFIDGLLTSAVCVAFVIVLLVERTSWAIYTPYADPIIVIALVIFSAPLPVSVIRRNLKEVLMGAPDADFQEKVRESLESATRDLPLESTVVRMVKVGRSLYVHLYLLVAESHRGASVDDLDSVRDSIATEISGAFPGLTIDVIFTRRSRWASLSTQPYGRLTAKEQEL